MSTVYAKCVEPQPSCEDDVCGCNEDPGCGWTGEVERVSEKAGGGVATGKCRSIDRGPDRATQGDSDGARQPSGITPNACPSCGGRIEMEK